MDKKELTPLQTARRRYEERNKDERERISVQFNTRIPRRMYDEINEFLKKHRISKVQLIFEGFESLKKQYEAQDKK